MDAYRVRPELDIWIIPDFAQSVLKFDPAQLQAELESDYPLVGSCDSITPGVAQWVGGSNAALKYRGRELKRAKMWFQRGDPRNTGCYTKYYYTGWQKKILPATSDIASCPQLLPIANAYDEWARSVGFAAANHYIVTKYADATHNIGWHYDKPKSIKAGSLITVVKIGPSGRRFQLRNRVFLTRYQGEADKEYKKRINKAQRREKPFFDQVLPPGAAVIMTLEANLTTQHAVPVVDEAGPSGSLVFRTITETVYPKQRGAPRAKRRRVL